VVKGPDVPGIISSGSFDLDDIGTEVSQQLSSKEPFLIG
jgi:hypothetical protein